MKDHESACSISFLEDEVLLSHTVVEIGGDDVVMRDIAGITETTVSVYSVKSIEKLRTKLE